MQCPTPAGECAHCVLGAVIADWRLTLGELLGLVRLFPFYRLGNLFSAKESHSSKDTRPLRVRVCLQIYSFYYFYFHKRSVSATNVCSCIFHGTGRQSRGGWTKRPMKMKLRVPTPYVHTIRPFCKVCKSKLLFCNWLRPLFHFTLVST